MKRHFPFDILTTLVLIITTVVNNYYVAFLKILFLLKIGQLI